MKPLCDIEDKVMREFISIEGHVIDIEDTTWKVKQNAVG